MLRERAGCQQANGMGLCDDFGRGLEARRRGEGGSAATNGALFYSLHRIRALPTAGPRGTIATFTHTLSFSPSLQPPPPSPSPPRQPVSASLHVYLRDIYELISRGT